MSPQKAVMILVEFAATARVDVSSIEFYGERRGEDVLEAIRVVLRRLRDLESVEVDGDDDEEEDEEEEDWEDVP